MKAFETSMAEMCRNARRHHKHVESLRTSKKIGKRVQQMKTEDLVGAMRWLGHARVSKVIKTAKNSHDAMEELLKEIRHASTSAA